jgi:hypothetical protein
MDGDRRLNAYSGSIIISSLDPVDKTLESHSISMSTRSPG